MAEPVTLTLKYMTQVSLSHSPLNTIWWGGGKITSCDTAEPVTLTISYNTMQKKVPFHDVAEPVTLTIKYKFQWGRETNLRDTAELVRGDRRVAGQNDGLHVGGIQLNGVSFHLHGDESHLRLLALGQVHAICCGNCPVPANQSFHYIPIWQWCN